MGIFDKIFGKKKARVASEPQFSQLPPPPLPMEEQVDAPAIEEESSAKSVATPVILVSSIPKYGDRTKDVVTLQRQLTVKGFSTNGVDGVFKMDTLKAIQKLQMSLGLAGSGVVGVRTLAALNMQVNGGSSANEPDESNIPSITEAQGRGRHLQLELESMLDRKCLELFPSDFPKAIHDKDGNMLVWMANRALLSYKVREKTNNNDGPMVVLIQKTVGSASNESWCMAQQQTCIAFAEKKTGRTSKIVAGEGVLNVADTSPKANHVKLADLQRGDLICWRHGSSDKGHTGGFDTWVKKLVSFRAVEGNTNAGAVGDKIVREGGGTYLTTRSTGTIGDMSVRAYLRPFVA